MSEVVVVKNCHDCALYMKSCHSPRTGGCDDFTDWTCSKCSWKGTGTCGHCPLTR